MDAWIASLADGSTKNEDWVAGHLSPWQRLMEYCKTQNTYVTNLRLTMGNQTKSCTPNAAGYWQAHGMPAVQGVECDEELHKWRGIGWVENDIIHIIWGARDPQTHKTVWWMDSRAAKNQAQVIWSRPTLVLSDEPLRGSAPVRNLKEFQGKIVGEDRGIYIPG